MRIYSKILIAVAIGVFSIGSFLPGVAADTTVEEKITVHFFEDRMCPVCRDQKNFMEEIKADYPQMELKIYSISDTDKLDELAEQYGVEDYAIMAPTTFIGDNFFQFRDFTERHKDWIRQALEGEMVEEDCCIITIPFLNIEIDIGGWSLPVITFLLGSLDGFNVCSIGALILILIIVLSFKSRKKVFLYGGLFIVSAAAIYGVLVFVWGWAFKALVGQLPIVRAIVGLAALGGGIFFFRQFLRFFRYGPTCQSSESGLAQRATERVKKTFSSRDSGALELMLAIVLFAAVITIVELPCSVGVPIAFTGVLAEAGVGLSTYVFYILLYLFFYMLIELIIFSGAVLTRDIWFANSNIITWVTLIGALVLFYLAFHYLIGF